MNRMRLDATTPDTMTSNAKQKTAPDGKLPGTESSIGEQSGGVRAARRSSPGSLAVRDGTKNPAADDNRHRGGTDREWRAR